MFETIKADVEAVRERLHSSIDHRYQMYMTWHCWEEYGVIISYEKTPPAPLLKYKYFSDLERMELTMCSPEGEWTKQKYTLKDI